MIHLLHAPIDPRAFARWNGMRALAGGDDHGLALHVLLSALFGKGAVQPFRLFAPQRGQWSLYAYAVQDRDALAALAQAVAPPEMLAVLPLDQLRGKPMPEAWPVGRRLGFDLLVRPVRRGERERDAFLDEAEKRFPDPQRDNMAQAERTREGVYAAWLSERLAGAARLEAYRLVAFQRRVVWRGGTRIEGPDATLQGDLVIEDGAAFQRLMAEGIGRHRAYGYGMVLLRPPGLPC